MGSQAFVLNTMHHIAWTMTMNHVPCTMRQHHASSITHREDFKPSIELTWNHVINFILEELPPRCAWILTRIQI